ncbi:MAG: hypothetical protein ACETWM_19555 [Candidatus Lokiarchaeia archaeon]
MSAATPGYGGYSPRPGFEILAAFEAVFGTFIWAAFIATFARKYMSMKAYLLRRYIWIITAMLRSIAPTTKKFSANPSTI